MAMLAVTALAEGDPSCVATVGREYMASLENSGLMDGMTAGESISKILGHQASDPFTVQLLCIAADLMARSRPGKAQARWEALNRQLGPRNL